MTGVPIVHLSEFRGRHSTQFQRALGLALAFLLVVETAPAGLARAEEGAPAKKRRKKPAATAVEVSPPPAPLTPPPQNAAPAFSAETPDAYYAHKRGVIALNTGHYAEAVKAFEEAYALNQDPSLLFNLAQAYRLAGQPAKALEACSSFLRSASATNADRAQVERFMAELEMITYQIRMQRDLRQPPAPGPIEPPALAEAPKPALDLTPRPPPTTSASLTVSEETTPPKPFYLRPVYWAAAAGVVAAGAVMIWYFTRPSGLRAPNTGLGYQQAFP
jgi:tetratricopeptide (TPR) repeat protein